MLRERLRERIARKYKKMPKNDVWLSVFEAAKLIGKDPSTVRRMAADGRVVGAKFPNDSGVGAPSWKICRDSRITILIWLRPAWFFTTQTTLKEPWMRFIAS